MLTEKLEKVIKEIDDPIKKDYFIKGALWILTQSLGDRLTKGEKEKIRKIMKYPQRYAELIQGTLPFQVIGIQKVLTEIFGEDFFNDK